MKKTILMAALFAAAGMPVETTAQAAEGEYYRGAEFALGTMPVDQVVTGGTRWRHGAAPRTPTSRDNRLPNDDMKVIR